MAKGNEIIVSVPPKGTFKEVVVVGTPLPGTIMTPVPGTAIDANGAISMEPAGASAGIMSADGDNIPIWVLDADWNQGKTASDAYATGTRGMVYSPAPGEELNVLFQNQSGTGDDVIAGTTLLMVDDGTGKVLPTADTPESEPFLALETVTDPTADQLIHVQYTGH